MSSVRDHTTLGSFLYTLLHSLEVVGKPVKLQSTTSLGALVPQSFKGVLDRIGLKPNKWF